MAMRAKSGPKPRPQFVPDEKVPAPDWEDAGLSDSFVSYARERAKIDAQLKTLEARKKELSQLLIDDMEEAGGVKRASIEDLGVVTHITAESISYDRAKMVKKFGVAAVESVTRRTPYEYIRIFLKGDSEGGEAA